MAGCSKHGYTYWGTAGYGKNSYRYCTLCRSLRTEEAVEPGTTAETDAFLNSKDTKNVLKAVNDTSKLKTKSVSEFNTTNEDGDTMTDDELLSRFGSRFGSLYDLQDGDRLRDAILGIMQGSLRAAASRYGLGKDFVFEVRLIIEANRLDLDAGVEKVLAYLRKRMAAGEPDKADDTVKGAAEKFKALFEKPAAD
jgi:hypothetical protein